MKKIVLVLIPIVCLALISGQTSNFTALAQEPVPGGIIGGEPAGENTPETQPAPAAGPSTLPEGKYLVDGELSDSLPAPSHPAVNAPPALPAYQDGLPIPGVGGEALSEAGGESGVPPPEASPEGTPNPCIPHSLIRLSFDEQTQPGRFADTTALRYEYRHRWVTFNGPAVNDGGAILDQSGNFGVNGYSAPNFLAFNTASSLNDGGVPRPPEYLFFLGRATYIELLVGSKTSAGESVTIEAFDVHNHSLGAVSTTLAVDMKKLALSAAGIYRVDIRTAAKVLVVDDLAFIPQAYPLLVDFDDRSAPALFKDTRALRSEYWMEGAVFSGPADKDGGAVLNKDSNFAVSGFSDPNFLAFNSGSKLSSGGVPRLPETVTFQFPVAAVQLYVGSGLSGSVGVAIQVEAFNAEGRSLGSVWRNMEGRMRPLTLITAGIQRLVISSTAVHVVVDDLIFVKEGAVYIDFDEGSQPAKFSNATALRSAYYPCKVAFSSPTAKNGGAILDQDGNFQVTDFTPRNFLAFNSGAILSDGGIPQPPEQISFAHPVDSVQFYVGSYTSTGSTITLQVYDKDNTLLGSRSLTLQPELALIGFHAPGITRAVISSPAAVFVVDGFNLHFAPLNYLPHISKND